MSSDQSDDGQEAQRLQVHDTDYENVEQNGAQDLPAEDDGLQSFSHSQAVAPHLDGTPALPNDKTSVGQHAENESESEGPDAVRKSGQEAPGTCMDLDQPTVLPYSEPVSLPSDHVHDRIKALEEDGVGEINELASAAESRKISIQEFECELQVYQENAAATMGRLPAKVQGAGNGKLDEELQATEFHIEMQQSRIRVLQEELRAMQAREKAAGETKGEVVGEGEDKRSEHGDAEPEGKGEVACADVAKALGRRDPASLSDWAIVDAETFSLNNLKEEISNLKQQLEDALQACQVMQVDIKSKEGDIKACESDLELSKARVVELEGEVSAHREGPQDSLKQGANVENDKIAPEAHEPAMHETLAACQADLKSSICKCTALEGENVSLQEQLKKSEELCRSLQSDNGIALAEVARLQKELKSALLQVDLAAGGALARVAELEVQLAHKTGEAEHLQHDLSVTRARGSVADALKKEIQVAEEKVKTLELERDAAKRAAAKAQELMDVAVAQLEKDSEANACLKKGVRGASSRGLPNQQLQNQMASEKSLRAANPGSLNREAGSQDDQADLQRSARALAVMEEAMIQIMHDHERKVADFLHRLGQRVDSANEKLKYHTESIQDAHRARPGLLVHLQGMAARLHNSEERSNSLRLEAAAMQVRIKSHEDEARTLKDQKARLSQQLKSAQEELDRSRRDAVRNDRAARELHRLLGGADTFEDFYLRFHSPEQTWGQTSASSLAMLGTGGPKDPWAGLNATTPPLRPKSAASTTPTPQQPHLRRYAAKHRCLSTSGLPTHNPATATLTQPATRFSASNLQRFRFLRVDVPEDTPPSPESSPNRIYVSPCHSSGQGNVVSARHPKSAPVSPAVLTNPRALSRPATARPSYSAWAEVTERRRPATAGASRTTPGGANENSNHSSSFQIDGVELEESDVDHWADVAPHRLGRTCRCVACQSANFEAVGWAQATRDTTPFSYQKKSSTTRGSCWKAV